MEKDIILNSENGETKRNNPLMNKLREGFQRLMGNLLGEQRNIQLDYPRNITGFERQFRDNGDHIVKNSLFCKERIYKTNILHDSDKDKTIYPYHDDLLAVIQ